MRWRGRVSLMVHRLSSLHTIDALNFGWEVVGRALRLCTSPTTALVSFSSLCAVFYDKISILTCIVLASFGLTQIAPLVRGFHEAELCKFMTTLQ